MANQSNNANFSRKGGGSIARRNTGSAGVPGLDDDRKIFVGGLSRETTEQDLKVYFTKYGFIDSVKIKNDPTTPTSSGFAFIVFCSAETISKVNQADEHIINNKKVDTRRMGNNSKEEKLFVSGITAKLSEENIKSYFGQFGTVEELEIPFDRVKNQRRNFCFVSFNSKDVVEKLIKTPKVFIKNVEVHIKKALPKSTGTDLADNQQGRTGFVQNFKENPNPLSYAGRNTYAGAAHIIGGTTDPVSTSESNENNNTWFTVGARKRSRPKHY